MLLESVTIPLRLYHLLNLSVVTIYGKCNIEGLHDAVRTYTGMIFPAPWFPFCTVQYGDNQKHPIILDSLHNRILNFTRVCG